MDYHRRRENHAPMLSPDPLPFKTMMNSRVLPRLSGFTILEVSGPDAAAFLQAQTMNDVLALSLGQWQWNGWLNPKGRVIALFALLKFAEEQFLAILPDFPAAELLPRLQGFVFRAKVRLRVVDEWACAADFPALAAEPEEVARGRKLDFSGDGGQRHLRLLPAGDARLAVPDPATDAHWLEFDLAHGLPRLSEQQREAWTPQMLALDRLNAFSLKKGCYPGQEIVARTHYLGQAKRQMVRVGGDGLKMGLELQDETERTVGTIISARDDGSEALAVVTANASTLRLAAGKAVTVLPLAGGLAPPL